MNMAIIIATALIDAAIMLYYGAINKFSDKWKGDQYEKNV